MEKLFSQGDQYNLQITVTDAIGTPLAPEELLGIRFKIGPIEKSYPETVTYDSENGYFKFPLTRTETRALASMQTYQCEVTFKDGDIYMSEVGSGIVGESIIRGKLWH